jgi:cytochrome c553
MMNWKRKAGGHAFIATLGLAFAGAAGAQTAAAPTQDALYLRGLAATCAACHGTDGRTAAGSSVPPLAGRPQADLAAKLRAFRSGQQPSTVMQQLAKGYSDAQIDALAGYFAARKP